MRHISDAAYGEEQLGKAYDAKLVRRLIGYMKPYFLAVLLCIFLLFVVTAIDLSVPLLVQYAIDTHISKYDEENLEQAQKTALAEKQEKDASASGNENELSEQDDAPIDEESEKPAAAAQHRKTDRSADEAAIVRIGILMLVLFFMHGIFGFGQHYSLQFVGQKMMFDIRSDLFGKLQQLPLSYFDRNPTGRTVTRITNDVNVIAEAFNGVLVYLFKDIFLMTGILIVMLSKNVSLTLIVLIPIPAVIIVSMIFRAIHRKAYRWTRITIAKVNSFLHESFSGVNIIKLFTREDLTSKEFAKTNEENLQANFKVIILSSIFNPVIMVITNISIALLIWFGGFRYLDGYLTFGELFVFLAYIRLFYQPIREFSQNYILMQSAMASSERIFQLMDKEIDIVNPEKPILPTEIKGMVEFRNVSFSYDGKTDVLNNVSFKVKPGKTLAMVGSTGAGKTTITNLLFRFYDVSEGQILIDGVDVRDWDLSELRKQMALVLQDVFIFSSDIKGNIRLGQAEITDDEVKEAARNVNAEEFILELTGGYDHELTERGGTLSVGQRQLLSFARALASNSKILVLDEATANIDTKTEEAIQDAIAKIRRGRTSLIVAHRLSTIKTSDEIIVLKHGRIIEQGDHETLIRHRGDYYKMYKLQFSAEEQND